MRSKLKPIDIIIDLNRGVSVSVFFDPASKYFQAVFAGSTYTATEYGKLVEQVQAAIVETATVSWQPVIIIGRDTHSAAHADHFGFTLERRWIATLPDGSLRKAVWEHQRLESASLFSWDAPHHGPFAPPCKERPPFLSFYYLPYSERRWQWLVALQAALAKANERFFATLDTLDDRLIATLHTLTPVDILGALIYAMNDIGKGEEHQEHASSIDSDPAQTVAEGDSRLTGHADPPNHEYDEEKGKTGWEPTDNRSSSNN